MPCVDNLDNFPMIVQRRNDWCIPASIENVLGYHEFGVSQEEIFTNYGRVRDPRYMNFDTISDVLENLISSSGLSKSNILMPIIEPIFTLNILLLRLFLILCAE